jgi:uncharacterized protein YndB with AHSA1/START domain
MADNSRVAEAGTKDLVIVRTFDAPRELVWKAWTDAEQLARWWGPENFTTPTCRIDLRIGGKFLYCMRSPDGHDYWATGEYKEIDNPQRLVYSDSFADKDGNVVSAAHYGMAGKWPDELLVTITFEESQGKTTMTLAHSGMPVGEVVEQTQASWNQSFDKLAEILKR